MHSAFIAQTDNLISEIWIVESGASCHMTHNKSDMYDVRDPSPSGREAITFEDKRLLKVEYVGNADVEFHGCTDVRLILSDVSYIPGLGFNLYYVHAVSRTNLVLFDSLGAHVVGTKITFP